MSFAYTDLLFKKYLGITYSNTVTFDLEAPGNSRPKLFSNSQLYSQPIPSIAPSGPISLLTPQTITNTNISPDLVLTGYTDQNGLISQTDNYLGTVYTSKSYPWIQYIKNLKLEAVIAGFSYRFTNPATKNNLLSNVIPFNYDPANNSYTTYLYTSTGNKYNDLTSISQNFYFIDIDAGYLIILNKNWDPIVHGLPLISFYRYNGSIGIPTNLGTFAGSYNQGAGAIAYGNYAGYTGQGVNSISIGQNAGQYKQGTGSIAIGYLAGPTGMQSNSIALNASGKELYATGPTGGFYVDPVASYSESKGPFTLLAYGADKQIVSVTGTVLTNMGIGGGGGGGSISYTGPKGDPGSTINNFPYNMNLNIISKTTNDLSIQNLDQKSIITYNSSASFGHMSGIWYSPTQVCLGSKNVRSPSPQSNLMISGSILPTISSPMQNWVIGIQLNNSNQQTPNFINYNNYSFIYFIGMGLVINSNFIKIFLEDQEITTNVAIPSNTVSTFSMLISVKDIEFYFNNVLIYTYILNDDFSYYSTRNDLSSKIFIIGKIGYNNDNYSLKGVGTQMIVSVGFSNSYPIIATRSSSADLTLTETSIIKQLNNTVINYVITKNTNQFCYLSCTAKFANKYGQFIGLSSTGSSGKDYGFTYHTDGHLYISKNGVNIFDLGEPEFLQISDTVLWESTVSLKLGIELSSNTILFYYMGSIVYNDIPLSSNYTGVFQVSAVNDFITNINYGYLSGNIFINKLWNNYRILPGTWYNTFNSILENFLTLTPGGYAYFDPTTASANVLNNFIIGHMPGRQYCLKVPIKGIYQINWTLDEIYGEYSMFISVNGGDETETINNNNNTYTLLRTYPNNSTYSLSTTLNLSITDYFCLGLYAYGQTIMEPAPGNIFGSFTINSI